MPLAMGGPSVPLGRADGARRNDGAAARLPLQAGWARSRGAQGRVEQQGRQRSQKEAAFGWAGWLGSAAGAGVLRCGAQQAAPPATLRGGGAGRRRRARTACRERASCACATACRRRRRPCACESAAATSPTPRCSLTPRGCRRRSHLTSRQSRQRRRGAAAPAAAACCGAGAGPAGGAASQRGAALGEAGPVGGRTAGPARARRQPAQPDTLAPLPEGNLAVVLCACCLPQRTRQLCCEARGPGPHEQKI